MEVKDYIIETLQELVNSFPKIRVRYEFDESSNSHFVEVVPNKFFHADEEYLAREEFITFDFIEKFPDQNITFISDDALVGLDRIDFEAKGINYDNYYSFSEKDFLPVNEIQVLDFTETFDFIFSKNDYNYAMAA